MSRPCFFTADLRSKTIVLDEDTSKHIAGVLRMAKGDEILLTDGQGTKARAVITDDNRKRCSVELIQVETVPQVHPFVGIGISLVKNNTRFEWFLEKATEIGVTDIIPLLCARTEKEKFRFDRLQGILTSALLQSQQAWLPRLHQPTPFEAVLDADYSHKFIAHLIEDIRTPLTTELKNDLSSRLILIGPEGDFTPVEIQLATQKGFRPVALGSTRLRTETASLVAATLLRMV
jgi:16S rRNA (uracil1498-N3)-methyltransferase